MLLCGCKTEKKHSLYCGDELKAGDVVLRRGNGITSRAVLMADKGGCYSHVGIVAESSGVIVIIHAVPDEHDGPNDKDRVKMDAVETFFSSSRTSNGRILRHNDTLVAKRASEEALRIYRKGMLFDHDYNEKDTNLMYCCELVEYAYKAAGGLSITDNARHDINLPAFRYESVILPSDFINSRHLKTVSEF